MTATRAPTGWGNSSETLHFSNVAGTRLACHESLENESWKRVKNPLPDYQIFEELTGSRSPTARKNHVVVNKKATIADADVPDLQLKAQNWDTMSQVVPNFTPAMLIVADIVMRSHSRLLAMVNAARQTNGLAMVSWVPDAIHPARNRFISRSEKKRTKKALTQVFGRDPAIWDQYLLSWQWKQERLSFAYPLNVLPEENRDGLRERLSRDPEYAQVAGSSVTF